MYMCRYSFRTRPELTVGGAIATRHGVNEGADESVTFIFKLNTKFTYADAVLVSTYTLIQTDYGLRNDKILCGIV